MQWGFVRCLVAFSLTLLVSIEPAFADVDKKLIEAGRRATAYVLIKTDKSLIMGSAFCIDSTGIFITNNHVVAGLKDKNDKILLVVAPGTKTQRIFTPAIVKTDPERDVAVLRVDRPGPLESLELASSAALASLRETSSVVAFGFPLGQGLALKEDALPEVTITVGRVSALRHDKGQLQFIQFDADVTHGNSGGPLIDERGQVIGIVTAGVEGRAINFAGPVTSIRSLLATANIVLTPQVLTDPSSARDLIDWLASDGAPNRLPVPADVVLKENQKILHDVLAAKYADKSSAGHYSLMVELLTRAAAAKQDPPGRYAMLIEARDLAIAAGDVTTAAYAASLLGESYNLKPADVMKDLNYRMTGVTMQPQESAWRSAIGMMLAEALARREQYADVHKLVPIVRSSGMASGNPTVMSQMRERLSRVEAMAAEYNRVQVAREKLQKSPDDPESSLTIGRYLCLTRGDFERGLPMLAKSSDAALKAIATGDLAKPTTPESQRAAGDRWWDLAAKEAKNPSADLCKARAGYWYLQAAPELTGLIKEEVDQRLEQLPPDVDAAGQSAGIIHLLPLVDDKDLSHAGWTRKGAAIISSHNGDSALTLPYRAPVEYDLAVECSRLSGNDAIEIAFPVGKGTCDFSVGQHGNRYALLGRINGKWEADNPTKVEAGVSNNERHRIEVKVRRGGVEGYIDGRRCCVWETNGDDLAGVPRHMPRSPGLMTVGSWLSDVAFFSVDVTERRAPGEVARERDADGWPYFPKVLRPSSDGAITLSARDATVHGSKITYDSDGSTPAAPQSLQDWSAADEYVTWFVDALKPGEYTVEVSYSCSGDKSGSDVEIGLYGAAKGIASATPLTLRVGDSGGWGRFRPVPVGKLRLSGGRQILSVKAMSVPHGAVMNLKQIVLTPLR